MVMVFIQNITTNQSELWEQTNNLYIVQFAHRSLPFTLYLVLYRSISISFSFCSLVLRAQQLEIRGTPIIMSPICLSCTVFKIKKVFPVGVRACVFLCVCVPVLSLYLFAHTICRTCAVHWASGREAERKGVLFCTIGHALRIIFWLWNQNRKYILTLSSFGSYSPL